MRTCLCMSYIERIGKTEEMKLELSKLKNKLGTPGAADRAAQLVYSMLAGD